MKIKSRDHFVFIHAMCGVLAVIITTFSGCLAATAGVDAGTAVYVRGDLVATLASDSPLAIDATRKAIKELGFTEVSTKKEGSGEVMVVRTTSDRKIEISISTTGKRLTEMKIRVDLFGDEQLSRSLLEQIKAAL